MEDLVAGDRLTASGADVHAEAGRSRATLDGSDYGTIESR